MAMTDKPPAKKGKRKFTDKERLDISTLAGKLVEAGRPKKAKRYA